MDNYILVGKIVNTFGIKGELKVVSDFEYKDRIFKKDKNIYVGVNKDKEVINTHRFHKNNDLLLFQGYSNINEVLKYKGSFIYIKKDDLELGENEYLLSDLIGYQVYDDDIYLGVVIDYEKNNNILLKIKGDKTFYLPLLDVYLVGIDKAKKIIKTKNGRDLVI